MSNHKSPWDIIGLGVIIALVIRALPFVLVFGLIFWLEGWFAWIGRFLLIGFLSFMTLVLTSLIEQRKHR